MGAYSDRNIVSRKKDGLNFTTQGTIYPNGDGYSQIPHCERPPRNHSERLKCFAKSHGEPVRLGLSRAPKHICSGIVGNPILSGISRADVMLSTKQTIYDDQGEEVKRMAECKRLWRRPG